MKKMLAVLLAVSIVLTLSITAFAAGETSVADPTQISPDADGKYSADTSFNLTVDKDATNPNLNSQINVSSPLSVAMYGYGADGSAAEPTEYRIENKGKIAVKVTNITSAGQNGWTLKAPTSIGSPTLTAGKLNIADYKPGDNNLTAKQLVLYINGVSVHEEITAPVAADWTVNAPAEGVSDPVKKTLPLECFVAKGDSTASALAVKVTYTIAAA